MTLILIAYNLKIFIILTIASKIDKDF